MSRSDPESFGAEHPPAASGQARGAIESTPTLPGGAVETIVRAPGARRPPLAALLVGALALFGLGSLIAYTLVRSLRPPAAVDTSQATAAAELMPSSQASGVATGAPSVLAAPSAGHAQPAPSASAAAAADLAAPKPVKPGASHPAVRPTAAATKTSNPKLDIQLQR